MPGRVYFISVDYLKAHTTINNNVDNNLLNNAIFEAQAIHIQTAMGSKLYNKLCNLISSGDITLPANAVYKTLLDEYVQECVSYWSWVEAIPYIAMKVVNKGVERQISDYSNEAELKEVEYLRDEIRNKAEFFSQRMIDYLQANHDKYPELLENHSIDEMHPSGSQYFSGLQFDSDGECACIKQMGYPCRTVTLQ